MTAPRRIVALEGLRGAAALLVVADHAINTMVKKMASVTTASDVAWQFGLLGVSAFFVISGIVMITVHGEDFGKPGAARFFLQKRLTRIVPLYWLATIIYAAKLYLEHNTPTLSDLTLSLLFIPHLGGAGKDFGWPVYGLGWTLQYEMVFYFVFAACLPLPKKIGLSLLIGLFPVLTALHYAGLFADVPLLDYVSRPFTLLFVAGILIGLARNRYFKNFGILTFNQAMLCCFAAMAGAMVAAHLVLGTGPEYVILAVCIGGILSVLACAMSKLGETMSLGERLAILIGGGSYAIYLSHSFALGPMGRIMNKVYHNCPVPVFVAMALVVALPLGLLTYNLVERPILRYLGRFTKGPKTVAAVPAVDPLAVQAR